MKYILLSVFGLLVLATIADRLSRQPDESDVPVLYWVTDASPARMAELELFYVWLEENDYPRFEIRLDNTNKDISKKLIQGVSGVGADIISMARDEAWLLHATGMMEDLVPLAQKHGFTVDETWPAAAPTFLIDGEQMGFPRGNPVQIYFLNTDLFAQHGQPLPPAQWTFEEFEAAGKAFVAAANAGKERQTVFFCDTINALTLRRGMGRSMFNETMTAATMDNPEAARVLRLMHKWIYEDRIIPTQVDLDFFAGSDTNTSRIQLFRQGRYALLTAARYSIVQLRDGDPMNMVARPLPHGGFPNGLLGSGSVGIYAKSEHKELAAYLLEFFASETYNMSVVHSSDSMPPVPRFADTEAYRRPAEFPGEWGVHGVISEVMEIGITTCASPFVLPSSANRIESEFRLGALAEVYSPEEAVALTEKFINREIELNVSKNPELAAKHAKLLVDQAEIDRLRAAGEPVPLEFITNPFYRRYYVDQGWAAVPSS
jgi:ABC-type glycerol-3-phosphate transport system substrate-binding protein